MPAGDITCDRGRRRKFRPRSDVPPGGIRHRVHVIGVREPTKRHGSALALDRSSFHVPPGQVTGFLGPDGAGKSTTSGVIVGPHEATSRVALVNGRGGPEVLRGPGPGAAGPGSCRRDS
ncbi:ATP-binding cassette domain-containing protein [Planomonospora alba]|uniref:ATP-binding cassette domain-containing protein n=1 Tax=Planomonospora alba TaxID=161354 RepID=UPI0031F0DEE8